MNSATVFFALVAVIASATAGAIGHVGIAKDIVPTKLAVEVRDGGVVKGSYSLVQPDGVLRIVNYISTPVGGFQAQVINKGVAAHPAIIGVGKGIGLGGVNIGAKSVIGGLGVGLGGVGLGGVGVVG